MRQYSYFEGTRHLGDSTPLPPGVQGHTNHQAYFCRHCGEIWGRILVPDGGWWQVSQRRCFRHGAGSFLDGVRDDTVAYWPRDLLMQEVQRFAHHIETRDKFDALTLYSIIYCN